MSAPASLRRVTSVARKELLQLRRDPATLLFALVIPLAELVMLGYAIDTNVRDIRTVVLDEARTQESRRLLQRFVNSKDFAVHREVFSESELVGELVAGRA